MEETSKTVRVVVLDSSIFIDHLRNYQPAVKFLSSLYNEGIRIIFSAVTETELITGKSCNDSLVRSKVLHMLNSLIKINVTNQVALHAGDLCREYEVGIPDAIIAATAITNKAELLTKNVKDFKKIEGLKVKDPY
jgi:tRNA(fMet)-specific endonuclease VapC